MLLMKALKIIIIIIITSVGAPTGHFTGETSLNPQPLLGWMHAARVTEGEKGLVQGHPHDSLLLPRGHLYTAGDYLIHISPTHTCHLPGGQ